MPHSRLPKGNAAYMSRLNRIKILSVIRERGEVSRAEIVREVGLSAPTVTRVVEGLIRDDQLAVEVPRVFEEHNIDDLLVVDADGRLVGAIDIQDLPKLKIL